MSRRVRPILVSACLAALFACALAERPVDPSTVTMLYCCGIWSVSPSEDEATKFLLFPPLVERDSTGEITPVLAQSWEHSDDHREWTVWLRSDAVWEDGIPVSAADVKFTFDFLELYEAGGDAYETQVVDDTTFFIRYQNQAPSPLDDWRVILPAHHLAHLDPLDVPRHEWFGRPVSAGPYRLVRSDPERMMEFEANPAYFGPKPAIDRVIVRFSSDAVVTDGASGADVPDVLSGQADVAPETAPADALKYGDDKRFERYYRIWPEVQRVLFWNLAHPLFESPSVRRALVQAIDRSELMRALNLPDVLRPVDVLLHGTQFWRGSFPPPVPFDLDEARRLLENAGWVDSDGDGVADRAGRPFRFEALVPQHPGMPEAAEFIQASLRRIGIHMEILRLDFFEVQRRMAAGEFEAAFHLLQQERTDRGHARMFGRNSVVGYQNQEVAQLLEQAGAEMDPERIDSQYRDLWVIFESELPALFLHPTVWVTVANRRVRGLSTPFRTDPARFMRHLWLEDDG